MTRSKAVEEDACDEVEDESDVVTVCECDRSGREPDPPAGGEGGEESPPGGTSSCSAQVSRGSLNYNNNNVDKLKSNLTQNFVTLFSSSSPSTPSFFSEDDNPPPQQSAADKRFNHIHMLHLQRRKQ